MVNSEKLDIDYQKAKDWADQLGIGKWVSESPATTTLHDKPFRLSTSFIQGKSGYTCMSVFSTLNTGYENYGIQIAAPYVKKTTDKNRAFNSLSISWTRYSDKVWPVISLGMDYTKRGMGRYYRNLFLNYEGGVSIDYPDVITAEILREANNIVTTPEKLAIQLLSGNVDVNNFDSMLSMLLLTSKYLS